MENDTNDAVILAARLLLATLFLFFGWRKLTDYSGTMIRMLQDRSDSGTGYCRSDLHGASGCVRGRCWSVHELCSWLYTRWEVRSLRIAIGR